MGSFHHGVQNGLSPRHAEIHDIILVFLILIFHFLHDLIFLTIISVLVLCLF